MFNLRYHVASLAAVFLALSVGLLLGTIVAERGMLTEQGSALVKDLQSQFDSIKSDNADLREGLERDRAFAEASVPALSQGRLEGTTVVILTMQGRVDGLGAVTIALDEAGATAASVSLEGASAGITTELPDAIRAALEATGGPVPEAGPELVERVAKAVAAEWREAGPRPVTEALVESGALVIEGIEPDSVVGALVVMAPGASGCDPFALGLASGLRASGAPVCGVEAQWRQSGVAAACVDAGFSAVDNVGTPQGRYSVIAVLSGAVEGYFGAGPDAEAPFAPLIVKAKPAP